MRLQVAVEYEPLLAGPALEGANIQMYRVHMLLQTELVAQDLAANCARALGAWLRVQRRLLLWLFRLDIGLLWDQDILLNLLN